MCAAVNQVGDILINKHVGGKSQASLHILNKKLYREQNSYEMHSHAQHLPAATGTREWDGTQLPFNRSNMWPPLSCSLLSKRPRATQKQGQLKLRQGLVSAGPRSMLVRQQTKMAAAKLHSIILWCTLCCTSFLEANGAGVTDLLCYQLGAAETRVFGGVSPV